MDWDRVARQLRVLLQDCKDKWAALTELADRKPLSAEEVAHISSKLPLLTASYTLSVVARELGRSLRNMRVRWDALQSELTPSPAAQLTTYV